MKILVLAMITALFFLFTLPLFAAQNPPDLYRAKIIQIQEMPKNKQQIQQIIVARFVNGLYQGKTIKLTNDYSGFPTDIRYTVGKLIFITEYRDASQRRFVITGPVRDQGVYLLIGIFVLSVLIIGGFQGIRALISLGSVCAVIFYILIPLVIRGYHPIPVTLILSAVATIFTLFFVSGVNPKTITAVIGTVSGVAMAGFLAWYFGNLISLVGYSDESVQMLQYTSFPIDCKGLLFSGIIIGALGAVMDVSMSIASALTEIKETNPKIGLNELMSSGFKVGKDVISTMTNTLVLAYVGSSFPLLMLYHIYQTPYQQIINQDAVAAELVRMFAGSIGLLAAIPVTTFIAAVFNYSE